MTRSAAPRSSPAFRRLLAVVAAAIAIIGASTARAAEGPVTVHLFWTESCPHCQKAKAFAQTLAREADDVRFASHLLSQGPEQRVLFERVAAAFDVDVPAVPLIVVGEGHVVGFRDARTTGETIRGMIAACRRAPCADIVGLIESRMAEEAAPAEPTRPPAPVPVRLPLFGEIDPAGLSLPALTVLMAAIDGFNPCAMWVLVFLISILVGMTDHLRMWLLGGAFLATSGLVYFVFLAAWLNVFLVLGALVWVRIVIGLLAIGGGGYYLREFFANPEGVCRVAPAGRRGKIMDRLKASIREKRFLYALAGIIAVAFGVNLIELLCSAGIPAVFAQVLAMSELPQWRYYAYLLLYVVVFLLDDLAIFAAAMATLQATGLTAAYSRYSRLIGGVVLCAIGMLLLAAPDLLTFSGARAVRPA